MENQLSVGGRIHLLSRDSRRVPCEVVGFRENRALLMAFGTLDGIGVGCQAEISESETLYIYGAARGIAVPPGFSTV